MMARQAISGRQWVPPTAEIERLGEQFHQHHGVELVVGNVLAARNLASEEVPAFLDPRLEDLMPDPTRMQDMLAAAERLAGAVRDKESVAVFGDYDVDGACSAAILVEWLRGVGVRADFEIPHRIQAGYGPNPEAMQRLAAEHSLIFTVDCGSAESSADAVLVARERGADVVVLDHHVCGIEFPWAHAVVNPKREDDDSGLDHLCAAGVVYMMLAATNRVLVEAGWWETNRGAAPDMAQWLDLVALATVADVVPLRGLNRALVRQGLTLIQERRRPGVAALADGAKVRDVVTESTISFTLAPRLNAPGRVGEEPQLAVDLLLTDEAEHAAVLAERCELLNKKRRELQSEVMEHAREQISEQGVREHLYWVLGEYWHAGVVGVVAGQLVDRLGKPIIVLTSDGDRVKGSGRAPAGCDLGAAVRAACDAGHMVRGGGHAAAVGMEMVSDSVHAAMECVSEALANGASPTHDGPRELHFTGYLQPGGVTWDLHEALQSAGPYGSGSAQPRFVLGDVELLFWKEMGGGSYRLTVQDHTGSRLKAIAFAAKGTPLGDEIESMKYDPTGGRGRRIDLLGTVEPDTYNNARKAFLRVEDMRVEPRTIPGGPELTGEETA